MRSRTAPLQGFTEKYPHTTPLAYVSCYARERSLKRRGSCRDEVSACYTTRDAGLVLAFQSLIRTQQRKTNALLFSRDCEQRPGRADEMISHWLHLVSELEDGSHYSFLCLNLQCHRSQAKFKWKYK